MMIQTLVKIPLIISLLSDYLNNCTSKFLHCLPRLLTENSSMMATFFRIFNFFDVAEHIFKFCSEQDFISVQIVLRKDPEKILRGEETKKKYDNVIFLLRLYELNFFPKKYYSMKYMNKLIHECCQNLYDFFLIFNLFEENMKYRLLGELMNRSISIQNEKLFYKCFENLFCSKRFGKLYRKWDDEYKPFLLCESSNLYGLTNKYYKNIYLIFRRNKTFDLVVESYSYKFYDEIYWKA